MFILLGDGKKNNTDESKGAVSGNVSAVSYKKYEKLRNTNKRTRIIKISAFVILTVVLSVSAILLAFALSYKLINKAKDDSNPPINLPMIDLDNKKSYIMESFVGEDINEKTAEKFEIPVGVKVIALKTDSRVSEAGLRVNDIITKVNNSTVTSVRAINELENNLDEQPDEFIVFTVYRNGAYVNIELYD